MARNTSPGHVVAADVDERQANFIRHCSGRAAEALKNVRFESGGGALRDGAKTGEQVISADVKTIRVAKTHRRATQWERHW